MTARTQENIRHASALWRLVAVCVAVAAAGCATPSEKTEVTLHTIDIARPETTPATAKAPQLKVLPFDAAERYASHRFVRRVGDRLFEYGDHQFSGLPAKMLRRETFEWLKGSGMYRSVSAAKGPANGLRLRGAVTALDLDEQNRASRHAVLGIHFYLVKGAPPEVEILHNKQYQAEATVNQATPESAVAAWGKALIQVLTELEADLAKTL
jgi:ABC-type uncharacterized transport system auxiliary subunit